MSKTRTRAKAARATRPVAVPPQGPAAPAGSDEDYEAAAWFMGQARSYYEGLPETDEETGARRVPYDYEQLLAEALRYAQTVHGAPGRCRWRDCRRQGRCCLRIEEGDFVCPAGVRPAQLDDAARMIGFMTDFFKRRYPAVFA